MGCLLGTTQSLESDCQRGLGDTVPCRMGSGGVHSLSTRVCHAVTVLESRHEAEGVWVRVVQS